MEKDYIQKKIVKLITLQEVVIGTIKENRLLVNKIMSLQGVKKFILLAKCSLRKTILICQKFNRC